MSIARGAFHRLAWVLEQTLTANLPDIGKSAELIYETLMRGNIVFACGNGGSAATAQHFTAELMGRYVRERGPFAAISLHTDSSLMTAVGNDYGYEEVFARQVRGLGKKGDTLVLLTTSGASKNVLKAIDAAKDREMSVIVLTGEKGKHLKAHPSVVACIVVLDSEVARIQEVHDLLIHIWCEYIDERMEVKDA